MSSETTSETTGETPGSGVGEISTLRWGAPPDGGSPILDYRVVLFEDSEVVATLTTQTTAVEVAHSPTRERVALLQARNAQGYSRPVNLTLPALEAPLPPPPPGPTQTTLTFDSQDDLAALMTFGAALSIENGKVSSSNNVQMFGYANILYATPIPEGTAFALDVTGFTRAYSGGFVWNVKDQNNFWLIDGTFVGYCAEGGFARVATLPHELGPDCGLEVDADGTTRIYSAGQLLGTTTTTSRPGPYVGVWGGPPTALDTLTVTAVAAGSQ